MKQIFPKEIIDNASEVHIFKHSTKSKVIYNIVLGLFLAALLSLPFLKVDVYTSASGIIKPSKERVALNVINAGRIIYNDIVNNKLVNKGDTLLIIDDNGIDNRLELINYQIQETKLFIEDLSLILKKKSIKINKILSSKYQIVLLQHTQKLKELDVRHKKIKHDYDRYTVLYHKGVVSNLEFENKKFDYDLFLNEINQFDKQQKSLWQTDLTQYLNQLNELKSKVVQLIKTKTQFLVIAPIRGTLLNIKSLENGSFVTLGTRIGEISPDTNLLVECYVNPIHIGLLKESTQINFQIDAFNYNQWGLASGQVIEIGKDIELIDNQPTFIVRCKLNEKYLKLKNGFKGNLKKGMTLNANFKLTERSLYNLLYDKMDNWLNPSRYRLTQP